MQAHAEGGLLKGYTSISINGLASATHIPVSSHPVVILARCAMQHLHGSSNLTLHQIPP